MHYFISFLVFPSVYLLIVGVEVIAAPDHTHISVGLLWTRDRPVSDLHLAGHNSHKRQTP